MPVAQRCEKCGRAVQELWAPAEYFTSGGGQCGSCWGGPGIHERDGIGKARIAHVMRYHEISSHAHPTKLAKGGNMDWGQQPGKFLNFLSVPGTNMIDLEDRSTFAKPTGTSASMQVHPLLMRLFDVSSPSPGPLPQKGPNIWLPQVLQDAFGLTAWKGGGASLWCLRANASSGALQPCEAYVIAEAGAIPGWEGGGTLFHYNPFWHALEVLCTLPPQLWARIKAQLPKSGVLVAITSFYWRNAWKYGDPGVRYVHQDLGHYIAALGYACAAEDIQMGVLEQVADDDLAALLGLNPHASADDQQPQALLALAPHTSERIDALGFKLPEGCCAVPFKNRAGSAARTGSKLSDVNKAGHRASWKPLGVVHEASFWRKWPPPKPPAPFGLSSKELRRIIYQRRSAHDFHPNRSLSCDQFFKILHGIMPNVVPFDALPYSQPLVPMILCFVHRVDGLTPGLYALNRDPSRQTFVESCAARYAWRKVDAAHAKGVPLFLLQAPEDVRDAAKNLSCMQEWAGNSCVTFAFFGDYVPVIKQHGAWMYKRAHWEAGIVGQAMYLAAESVGFAGTAMGCYFGPWTHQVLGIDDEKLQDMEHFTIGFPTEDDRIQGMAPYAHLKAFRSLSDRCAVETQNEDKSLEQLLGTRKGKCDECGKTDVEGRQGTDEYAGQFYCGRCWIAFDPKVQEGEKADKLEEQQEPGPDGYLASGGYPNANGVGNASGGYPNGNGVGNVQKELSPAEAQRKAIDLMRQEEEAHRRAREEQYQRQAEQDKQRLQKIQEEEQRRQRAIAEQRRLEQMKAQVSDDDFEVCD